MENEQVHIVRQGVVTLPFLDDEVPALYTADNKPYIPAFAVCHALGLPVKPHIRKWANMLLWVTAQKLPLHTSRGTHKVWCLLISEVPFLYGNVIWKYVSDERRQPLHEATKKGIALANQAYQHMQKEYHDFHQMLFKFLHLCAEMESLWDQWLLALQHSRDREKGQAFEALVQEGRTLYHNAATLAKELLQERGSNPVIDAFIVGKENTVEDSFSMPLLPVIDREKKGQFMNYLTAITNWQGH